MLEIYMYWFLCIEKYLYVVVPHIPREPSTQATTYINLIRIEPAKDPLLIRYVIELPVLAKGYKGSQVAYLWHLPTVITSDLKPSYKFDRSTHSETHYKQLKLYKISPNIYLER